MNYYKQGNPAKAKEIKAAFERNGIDTSANSNYGISNLFYFSCNDEVAVTQNRSIINIIKTHPDYQELELPVEPKFKVGDFIADNYCKGKVIGLTNDAYLLDTEQGIPFSCEHNIHLWTIQDAKDGDILMTTRIRNCPFIYRKTTYKNDFAYYYAGIDGNGDFCEGCLKRTLCHFGPLANVVPATKEQRDLLFTKMKKAGYQWDADKKELCKIKSHYDISNFHAGMPVLVRILDEHKWCYLLFSHCYKHQGILHFHAGGAGWRQCIPFNEGTEHLLGTTDMCPDEYINW